jgi:hypothetical protein
MYSAALQDEYAQNTKMIVQSTQKSLSLEECKIKRMINARARRSTQYGRDEAVYPSRSAHQASRYMYR